MTNYSLTELIQAIQSHCKKCCSGMPYRIPDCKKVDCEFFMYRKQTVQKNLFTDYKEIWYGECLVAAKGLGDQFYFSQLRTRCSSPFHKNWWGGLGTFLKKHGFYKCEQARRNPLPITKGSEDYLWKKKAVQSSNIGQN